MKKHRQNSRPRRARGFIGSGLALSGGVGLAILIQVFAGSAAYSDDDTVAFSADPQEKARLEREAAACHADVNCFVRHMVTYASYSKGYYEASIREMHANVRNAVGAHCQNVGNKILERTECYKDGLGMMVSDAGQIRDARSRDPESNTGDELLGELRSANNWAGQIIQSICGQHPTDRCFDSNLAALQQEVTDAHNAMVGSFLNLMRWSVTSKKCDEAIDHDTCRRAKEFKPTDFLVADANSVRYRPSTPLPGANRTYTPPQPGNTDPAPHNPDTVVPPPRGPVSPVAGNPRNGSTGGNGGRRGRHTPPSNNNDPGNSSSSSHGNGGTGGPGHGFGTHGNGSGGGATAPSGLAHPLHPGAGGGHTGGIGAPAGSHGHLTPSVAGPTGPAAPTGSFHPVPPNETHGHHGPTGAHASTGVHASTGEHASTGTHAPTGAPAPTGWHAPLAPTGTHASTGAHAPTGVTATTGVHASTGALAPTGAVAATGVIAQTAASGPVGASGPIGATGAIAATAGTGSGHGGNGNGTGGPSGVAGGTGHGLGVGGGSGAPIDCSPDKQGQERNKGRSTTSMSDRLEGQSYIYECSVVTFYAHNRSAVFLAASARKISNVFQSTILSCSEVNDDLTWMDSQLTDLEGSGPSAELTALHDDVRRLQTGGCGAVMMEFSNGNGQFQTHLCAWKRTIENAEPGSTIGFPRDIANCR